MGISFQGLIFLSFETFTSLHPISSVLISTDEIGGFA